MQALTQIASDDWWRGAVGYEVYVRSFQDSDGDGVGDLAGVAQRIPYLASLGVDVVWLTPFFPSPGHDHGYDVSNYLDVDPLLGTLADWEHLAATANAHGLRLMVDIVPNHTSHEHEWFRAAVADPAGPFRQYYVWADPAPDGGPPNNWVSHFGGPAWSLDPGGSGQYYCHLFLPEQPDLNWANPQVMDEFAAILRCWVARGADGFRIDVAHGLTKDPALRDNPQIRPVTPDMHPMDAFASFEHVHDLHRHETAILFRQWRAAVAGTGAVLVGEMDTRDVDRFAEYVAGGDALHAAFVLQVGLTGWEPESTLMAMLEYQSKSNGGTAWEVSNHDQSRAVSRYGGGATGRRRALALTAAMMAFDGIVFLYQGEELGLPDAVLVGVAEDPMAARNGDAMWSRDVSRGPMPWSNDADLGFSSKAEAWLAVEPTPTPFTVEHQRDSTESPLQHYRELVGLRRRAPEIWQAPFELLVHGAEHVIVRRGDLVIVANLGATELTVDRNIVAGSVLGELVFASEPGAATVLGVAVAVAHETTCVWALAAA